MIKSIRLKNFQSHADTEIVFDKGVNCIVGSSNNGKSAVLRGLYWARYNRPLGIDTLASHWALNDKGNLADEMSVTVENDNGKLTRKRTKNENQYIVNGKVLNVVKSDVPDEVESFFNLSETNIQNQQDAPFLLSKSSGEVAKYFNRVVKLDVIDRVLTNAESVRRKTNAEIENTEKIISQETEELENYQWLDSVEILLNKYERVSERLETIKNNLEKLEKQIQDFNSFRAKIKEFESVSGFRNQISEIEVLGEKLKTLTEEGSRIKKSVDTYKNQAQYPDFTVQKKLVEQIDSFDSDTGGIDSLNEQVEKMHFQKNEILKNERKISEWKLQLPKTCPLCGAPMEKRSV